MRGDNLAPCKELAEGDAWGSAWMSEPDTAYRVPVIAAVVASWASATYVTYSHPHRYPGIWGAHTPKWGLAVPVYRMNIALLLANGKQTTIHSPRAGQLLSRPSSLLRSDSDGCMHALMKGNRVMEGLPHH